mgnify:CR=1 FL=1
MADGSVIIDTKIDASGVEKGADDIVKSLESILGYMQNISSSINKIVSSLTGGSNTASNAVSNLTDNLEATAEAGKRAVKAVSKFDPSDVSGLTIHRWNDNSNLIGDTSEISEEQRRELAENAKAARESAQEAADAFNGEKEKVNELYDSIKKLKAELKSLEKSGKWWGDDEYDEAAIKLNELNKQAQEYKKTTLSPEIDNTADSVSRLGQKVDSLSKKLMNAGISGLKNKIKNIGKTIDGLVSKLLKLTSSAIIGGLQRISSGIFGIHKSANKSTLSLKNLLKYAFGIRSLFVLFNKLRNAIVAGFQNLAKYDLATRTGQVNNSISSLTSALTRLKNSFATAFAPILTTVAPILVRFINLISEAVTRVGMLVAALTGKDTFTKAIGVQENYAASLDKSSKSANKAKKATKGYLSSLDEISRYDDGKSDSEAGSGGGGYTAPSASEMFETVPIESSIKDIADKIKGYIQNQDWEGLGSYMADGINTGLEKVYNVINWDNVGPKIEPFITGFTTTFNSLVDNINWELMGQTVGTGINTIVKALNLAITGIDWYNLGKKFAIGIRGIITEVNWNEVGQLIGNKFMAAWRIFGGFVKNLPYRSIGKAVAEGLNGVFKTISFLEISDYLTTAINGAFDSLDEFTRDFEWDEFAENVKNGITDFINGINWKENGQTFGEFLSKLCDTINESITKDTFYKLGKGIGDFLGQLPWGKLLWTAGKMIIGGIKWALQGLWESEGLPGKIAAIIGAAIAIIKITDITGIGSLVALIIGHIGTKIAESKNAELIASKLSEVIGKGTEQATGALEGLGNAAETSGGQLGGFWSAALNVGATAFVVQQFKDVKTAMDFEESTADAFNDFEVVRKALKSLEDQSVISGDKLIGLGGDLGSVKDNTFDFDQQFQTVITTLKNAGVSSDAFKTALKTALEESNVSTNENIKKINEYLGNMDNKFINSKKTAENKMSGMSTAVGTAMSSVQSATEKAMSAAEKSVSDSTSNINTDTTTNWGNSAEEVDKNLDRMKQHANLKLGEMHKTVESHFSSQYNTMTKKWERAQERIEQIVSEMIKNINTSLEGFSKDISSVGKRIGNNLLSGISSGIRGINNILKDVIDKVNSMVGNINNAISGIERGFTFSYNVQLPNGGRRWGNYSMRLPRVSTVPYLASGAVIPPRSEFLAVLGDQKNGRNLEAPEDLLRQIVREEAGGNQGSGGNYRFTAQLNRRTIFDEMIDEAKLRRDASGTNPFELA